ncbi:alkaline phosphatase [Anaerocolumna cellulosilytica]|uniref:Alkaline phosphatase n=1 Tax=Anaerocolumna cellulosilytica TaxID=433286 RepID=A0A6S6QZV5_9FIRM|nr:alkaline phosphatase [Anaerocolumna cellulosilytica]MBB5194209.1 alkaline phosphatase [Anaerocolumna cellulosilytica]BCJ94579.1 alkaline phosphatase [Anaerocolumna cellulosilytica]
MHKIFKRVLACAVTGILVFSVILTSKQTTINSTAASSKKAATASLTQAPKYVFMFIGDGMSYPQIQAASDYLGALGQNRTSDILSGNKYLNFMKFPVAGSAVTYDSTSFCPDSASTATSLATGFKTYSGTINMNESMTISYETISEKLKEQLRYKIGIISTVNLNHATPAAYYAHQASRNNYYGIGLEMIQSGFDYFAGGALKNPNGDDKNNPQTNLYELAQNDGYKVIKTQAEAEKLTAADGKAIVIGETLADSDTLSYANDAKESEWALKDYVKKGIEVLDNETGFFMMVEAGKIDWACHANDAGSTIADTIALDDAVNEAIKFYNQHPQETLIIVTGDHETGGLTIGYAGTDYDTYLTNLSNQKISYAKFDTNYVKNYKANKTEFKTVLADIKENFGLLPSSDKDANSTSKLVLTDYEYTKLKQAYEKTLSGDTSRSQEEYILYGTYEPLTVTITHILNNKSGINFSSYAHTGLPVGVFAQGQGAELFSGYYDNTEIYKNLASLLKVN